MVDDNKNEDRKESTYIIFDDHVDVNRIEFKNTNKTILPVNSWTIKFIDNNIYYRAQQVYRTDVLTLLNRTDTKAKMFITLATNDLPDFMDDLYKNINILINNDICPHFVRRIVSNHDITDKEISLIKNINQDNIYGNKLSLYNGKTPLPIEEKNVYCLENIREKLDIDYRYYIEQNTDNMMPIIQFIETIKTENDIKMMYIYLFQIAYTLGKMSDLNLKYYNPDINEIYISSKPESLNVKYIYGETEYSFSGINSCCKFRINNYKYNEHYDPDIKSPGFVYNHMLMINIIRKLCNVLKNKKADFIGLISVNKYLIENIDNELNYIDILPHSVGTYKEVVDRVYEYITKNYPEITTKGIYDLVYSDNDKTEERGTMDQKIITISNNVLREYANFLSGLLDLKVMYSEEYNKIVYLLGEEHGSMIHGCPIYYGSKNSKDFFYSLITMKDKKHILDVFLEVKYDPTSKMEKFPEANAFDDYIKERSYIAKIRNELTDKNCFTYGCEPYNEYVRFHNINIRRISINEYFYKLYYVMNIKLDSKNPFIKELFMGKYDHLNNLETMRDLIMDLLYTGKVFKQIQNIPVKYDKVKKIIKEYIDQKLSNKNLAQYAPDIVKSVLLADKIDENKYKGKNLYNMAQDLYFLSRMFRAFIPHYNQRYKNKMINYGEPTNVILYEGNAHSETISGLLLQLQFKEIYKSTKASDNISCISINKFDIKWLETDIEKYKTLYQYDNKLVKELIPIDDKLLDKIFGNLKNICMYMSKGIKGLSDLVTIELKDSIILSKDKESILWLYTDPDTEFVYYINDTDGSKLFKHIMKKLLPCINEIIESNSIVCNKEFLLFQYNGLLPVIDKYYIYSEYIEHYMKYYGRNVRT